MKRFENDLKYSKLLQFINEFWICFSEDDKGKMYEIAIKTMDKMDRKIKVVEKKSIGFKGQYSKKGSVKI